MIDKEKMKFRKRIVCPCCGEGFIKREEIKPIHAGYSRCSFEKDPIFMAPTMDYPMCNNCKTKFRVTISSELIIDLEVVGR